MATNAQPIAPYTMAPPIGSGMRLTSMVERNADATARDAAITQDGARHKIMQARSPTAQLLHRTDHHAESIERGKVRPKASLREK